MSAVDVFFQNKARLFTKGQIESFEEIMPIPSEVAMGTRAIVFTKQDQIAAAMKTYRRRLGEMGYSYSSAQTEYQEQLADGLTYALVRFSHFDHSGAEIAHLNASYFVDVETTHRPIVHKVEFLEDPFSQEDMPTAQA